MTEITEVENTLINTYSNKWNNVKLTSTILQRLSADISNIMIDEVYEITGSSATTREGQNARNKRRNIINNTFQCNFTEDEETSQDYKKILEDVKTIACKYYEFTQFKRALFNCTEVIYDQATGRIREMNFEVHTKDDKVVFN